MLTLASRKTNKLVILQNRQKCILTLENHAFFENFAIFDMTCLFVSLRLAIE